MKKNLSSSLLVLAVIVFAAIGCNMSKKSGATNGGANSSSDNTTTANNQSANRADQPAKLSSKSIAWELGNGIGTAAILYDMKGRETSDSLTKAKMMAREIGADIPPFPAKTGDKNKDTAATLDYLMSNFRSFYIKISDKYGREEAALFEMSLKSSLLLLIYSPGESEGRTIAKRIRSNAETAELPENLWLPAIKKIESDASFDEVGGAIAEMQKSVSRYLGKS